MTKLAFMRGPSTGSALLTVKDGEPIWETDTQILKVGQTGSLYDVCMTNATQTLTNKTLAEPQLSNPARFLDPNGNVAMQFIAAASAVNYVVFNNSAAGSPAAISVLGADASIDILVRGKGQGRVVSGSVGNYYPVNDENTANPTESYNGLPLVNGQRYYNTTDNEWYYYDGGRSKWLSDHMMQLDYGHSTTIGVGVHLRAADGAGNTNSRYTIPFTGTIIGYSLYRSDTVSTTFEVVVNGSTVALSVPSAATTGQNFTSAVNVDVVAGDTVAVRNSAAGAGAAIKTFILYVKRRRA